MPKTQYGTIIKPDGTHEEILPVKGKKFTLMIYDGKNVAGGTFERGE